MQYRYVILRSNYRLFKETFRQVTNSKCIFPKWIYEVMAFIYYRIRSRLYNFGRLQNSATEKAICQNVERFFWWPGAAAIRGCYTTYRFIFLPSGLWKCGANIVRIVTIKTGHNRYKPFLSLGSIYTLLIVFVYHPYCSGTVEGCTRVGILSIQVTQALALRY